MESENLKRDHPNESNTHSDCNQLKHYSLEEIHQPNEGDKIFKQRGDDVDVLESISKLSIREEENIKDVDVLESISKLSIREEENIKDFDVNLNGTSSSKSSIAIPQNILVNKSNNKPQVKPTHMLPVSLHFMKTDPLTKTKIVNRSDTKLKVSVNDELLQAPETFPNPFYVAPLTPEIKERLAQGEVLENITISGKDLRDAMKNKLIVLPKRKHTKRKKKAHDIENN